jgi:hypothetical protein
VIKVARVCVVSRDCPLRVNASGRGTLVGSCARPGRVERDDARMVAFIGACRNAEPQAAKGQAKRSPCSPWVEVPNLANLDLLLMCSPTSLSKLPS